MELKGLSDEALRRVGNFVKKGQEDYEEPLLMDEPEEESGDYTVEKGELLLFIENDGDLYRQMTVPIYKNMARKMQRGVYDHEQAVKGFMYLADAGAKKYHQDFDIAGEAWHQTFPKSVRMEVAQELADQFLREWEGGELEDVLEW